MKKDTDHIHAVPKESPPGPLPVLLRQVKDDSLATIMGHLENLFGSCDDLFFDLSSRAVSNSEQNLYFESMREVRLRKNGVTSGFKRLFESGFNQLANNTTRIPNPQVAKIQHNTLSLVQNDALEQDVAISSMANKARTNCQESLYHLNARLDFLSPSITVTKQNNPMDPQQICNYFAEACNILDINIKARIILFKQFDRLIVNKLAIIYSAANNTLIEAGVLPQVQFRGKTNPSPSAPQTENNSLRSAGQMQQAIEMEFAELSVLLANIRQQSPENLAGLAPNYTQYSANPGPALAGHELLQLLSSIQQNSTPSFDEELQLGNSLRQIISSLLSNHGKEPERALNQPEDDTINLVAMFFDFVLDDKNLPVPVQALISRLQIPVLRIALKDKTFFSNSSHPARTLINTIAEASIGWDDTTQPQKDHLYALITKITQDINEQYIDSNVTFTLKLDELHEFIMQTKHKSNLIEKRTGQAAEGQAKTKLAKTAAQNTMYAKLEAVSLPETISQFLTEHWLNLLLMTHLKHGEDSPEWVDATQLIDDLAWASQQHKDPKSQARYTKIKPNLLSRIATGMNQIANSPEAANSVITQIDKDLDLLQTNGDNAVLFRPLSVEQAKELGHTPGGGSKSWKNMTGVERQQARYKQLTYDYIRKVEQLPLHTWVSYTNPSSGETIRCKLASKIESSDTYIFVNRYGFKALERSRKDFACDMQANRVTVLDSGQLFDRAMGSILGRLNKTIKPQAAH
ncbi:MAG: DUF1631 domain-containing protein [Spongiibacteraceae bacterium]